MTWQFPIAQNARKWRTARSTYVKRPRWCAKTPPGSALYCIGVRSPLTSAKCHLPERMHQFRRRIVNYNLCIAAWRQCYTGGEVRQDDVSMRDLIGNVNAAAAGGASNSRWWIEGVGVINRRLKRY